MVIAKRQIYNRSKVEFLEKINKSVSKFTIYKNFVIFNTFGG